MKILVAVKRVVDHNVVIRVKSDKSGIELQNVKMAINPFCEIAVEEAVRLKESGAATEVVVVSIGNDSAQDQLRTAMAMGADRGILVKTDADLEPLAVAKLLKEVTDKEQPGLVMLGKQAIDSDCNQTAQMLAALTDLPQATYACKVECSDENVIVDREIDGGTQRLKLTLPAVISVDLRLNEPRFTSLPNIMKAKRKPLVTLDAASLVADLNPKLNIIKVEAPAKREAGQRVSSIAELIDKLKNEQKVI